MSYHLTPVRMATIQEKRDKWQWGCRERESWCTTDGNVNWCSHYGWGFLKNLKIELPYHPAIPILGIYPKEMKTGYGRVIHTPMFITVWFTIAKIWKQPKCFSVDEWPKKIWQIYTYNIPLLYYICIYNGILFRHEKEGNPTICENIYFYIQLSNYILSEMIAF